MMTSVKVITELDWLKTVAERWVLQYRASYASIQNGWYDEQKEAKYHELKEECAKDHPDRATIDTIIGNATWTRLPNCDVCKEVPRIIVRMEELIDEYYGLDICPQCLSDSLLLAVQTFTGDKSLAVALVSPESLDHSKEQLLAQVLQRKPDSDPT